jgi:acyl-coenzyme A thioesterase PaaI-like protein
MPEKKVPKSKKSRRVNENGKELLQILMRESVRSGFGKFMSSTIQSINYSEVPEKLIYRYKVPPSLCHAVEKQEGKKELIFSTSGVLSVLDELSTYAIVLEDKSYRPGVSVDLSAESLKPVHGNEEVLVVTRTDKIGKILAFCTMELTTLDGEILARGKHVKYLPMGFMFDLIFGTFFLPVFLFFYKMFRGNKFSTPLDATLFPDTTKHASSSVPVAPELSQHEFVFKSLNVKKNENPLDRKTLLEDAPDNHHCEVSELFELKVTSNLKNGLGNLHGGALAVAIEESSRQFKEQQQTQLTHLLKLRTLNIRYISAMKVILSPFFN